MVGGPSWGLGCQAAAAVPRDCALAPCWGGAPALGTAPLRKRHASAPRPAGAGGPPPSEAPPPRAKRARLRPSLGQLRLRREADSEEVRALQAQACLALHPERLRASVSIGGWSGGASVQVEVSFPPQYPHRPPTITQVLPERPLPAWEYEGREVLLRRVRDGCWTSTMGVADIVRDLAESLRPHAAPAPVLAVACDGGGRDHLLPHAAQAPALAAAADDVDMA